MRGAMSPVTPFMQASLPGQKSLALVLMAGLVTAQMRSRGGPSASLATAKREGTLLLQDVPRPCPPELQGRGWNLEVKVMRAVSVERTESVHRARQCQVSLRKSG